MWRWTIYIFFYIVTFNDFFSFYWRKIVSLYIGPEDPFFSVGPLSFRRGYRQILSENRHSVHFDLRKVEEELMKTLREFSISVEKI